MKALNGLWNYLKDWKNLLTHSLIGVGILLVAYYLPVRPMYRILFFVAVVIFNIVRMRFEKKKELATEGSEVGSSD
jgi:hypothetical protein